MTEIYNLKTESQNRDCCSPCEVVGDHGSSDSHLLEGKDELSDPDETHSMVPHQVLKRPLHFIFHNTRGVVLYGCPCEVTQAAGWSVDVTVSQTYLTLPEHLTWKPVAVIFTCDSWLWVKDFFFTTVFNLNFNHILVWFYGQDEDNYNK